MNITHQIFKELGIDESVETCDCCGRTGLKYTVALEYLDGSGDVHYGRVCAARALGWAVEIVDEAVEMEQATEAHRLACSLMSRFKVQVSTKKYSAYGRTEVYHYFNNRTDEYRKYRKALSHSRVEADENTAKHLRAKARAMGRWIRKNIDLMEVAA